MFLVTFWNTRRANLLAAVGTEKNPRGSVCTLHFPFGLQFVDLFEIVVGGELFNTSGRDRVSSAAPGTGKFLSISWKDDNVFTSTAFQNIFCNQMKLCSEVSKCIEVNEGQAKFINCNQLPGQVADQNCEAKFRMIYA